jgi:hypothetical protein
MARAERRLTWAGQTTRQLPVGLCRPKGQVRCDPAMGLQTDPEATRRPMRDRDPGSTEGNGLLEPYEGQLSSTVLRGGGGGDAAPLPDTEFVKLLKIAANTVHLGLNAHDDQNSAVGSTGDLTVFEV